MPRFAICLVAGFACAASPCLAAEDAKKLTFEASIAPIFKAKCLSCHSGAKPKAGLNLSTRRRVLLGGISGAAVRRAAAESSLLWERVAAGEMPPKGPPLTAEEKGLIRTWINDGALGEGDDPEVADEAPDRATVTDEDREFWSFRTPRRAELPDVREQSRARNAVDQFILAKLETAGLTLSPEATRETLIRRAYYDLLGLPPTPADVAAFVADERPDAYEQLIERLLASPHYGERWGRHWLDVAGYADSAGILNEDRPLQFAWRYRDYVIAAFNKDKPYDRFLQEQIAGDELTNYWHHFENDDRLPADVIEGVIATGYLRCASDPSRPDFTTIKNADAQYFYPTINDTMQIVSTSTMGLSLQCARCHNHMFDPIPQDDFYRVQAIFMSAYRPTQWIPQMKRRIVEASKSQIEAAEQRGKEVDEAVAKLKQQVTSLRDEFKQRLFDDRLSKLPEPIRDDVRRAIDSAVEQRSAVDRYLTEKFQAYLRPDDKTVDETLPKEYPDFKKRNDELASQVAAEEQRRYWFDEIRALYDLPGEVPTPFLRRGDALTPGRDVQPGTLSVLNTVSFDWQRPDDGAKTSGRRLAFARWLTDPRHPLTARVMVNRLWQHHFGRGIVATPDDFGRSGAEPTHPELLDWLAVEFVESGWRFKQMHRLLMNSAVYRQQSGQDVARAEPADEIDPDNHLLWRQRLRRLEAEPLRDAVLAVAGTLNGQLFGRPIRMQRHGDGEVTTLDGQDPYRRSIYLQILRLTPLTMLNAFDQPVMETNCSLRSQSTVSTQALTLLNSDTMVGAAEAFADRVLAEASDGRGSYALQVAFGRSPTDDERQLLAGFLKQQTAQHLSTLQEDANASDDQREATAERRALADLCHMLLSSNEFVYID